MSNPAPPDNPIVTALNTLPKHVVSSSLSGPTWPNTHVISSDVLAAVSALKDRPGRELQVHGSCRLARALHDGGVVDGYRCTAPPDTLTPVVPAPHVRAVRACAGVAVKRPGGTCPVVRRR
ncbi:MAG TPA: dihydrofolate reductase family protein [Pseudonocardia sp.]|nr:dihydrofolate reductase family protein [Pseudonocardia sp.]